MANFEKAAEKVALFEGGYSNLRADRGGETYAGISRVHHPGWSGWVIIDSYRKSPQFPGQLDTISAIRQKVKDFYFAEYWVPLAGPALRDDDVAIELYEQAINMGRVRAIRNVQRALNVVLPGTPITVDGRIGPQTLRAIHSVLLAGHKTVLLTCLNILQGAHYISLVEQDPVQEVFAIGWLRRCELKVL